MRLLVAGPRVWPHIDVVYAKLDELNPDVIIHGAATGVDTIAASWGYSRKKEVIAFPANWRKHGKAAGSIRNAIMLKEGKPDELLAFQPMESTTPGTQDMIKQAKAKGSGINLIRVVQA